MRLVLVLAILKSFVVFLSKAQQGSNAPKKSAKKNVKREADEENPQDFVDPDTPLGEKKRLSSQMAKQYSPAAVEKS